MTNDKMHSCIATRNSAIAEFESLTTCQRTVLAFQNLFFANRAISPFKLFPRWGQKSREPNSISQIGLSDLTLIARGNELKPTALTGQLDFFPIGFRSKERE
jgi:hypothetical protein